MIIDIRKLDSESEIKSDVCIVGGGAAGITLARELSAAGLSVSVFESGGFVGDPDTQKLSEGKNTGMPYFPVILTSTRFLGGNTNRWGSWCRPLDAMDMEKRDWVPNSGWPITRAELDPYYMRGQEILGLREYNYNVQSFLKLINKPELKEIPLESEEIMTKIWQFRKPPMNFGLDYREEINLNPKVKLHLHGILTDIKLKENGKAVDHLEIKTLDKKLFRAKASHYVLALGGIENPRILLASRSQNPNGVGNEHDTVGRYFMEHPHLHRKGLCLFTGLNSPPTLYNSNTQYTEKVVAGLCPSKKFQIDEKILNFSATFAPSERYLGTSDFAESKIEYISNLLWDLYKLPSLIYRKAKRKVTGKKDREPERFLMDVNSRWEQAPNPESRIKLGTELDALGVPKTNIHWKLLGIDRKTAFKCHSAIGHSIAADDLGRFRLEIKDLNVGDADDWDFTKEGLDVQGGWHHMGSTRMHDDPRQGVVDKNCTVHGIDNLHIAGSSVFTTSGYANPTLTLVSLAVRLADHIKNMKTAR